MLGGRLRTWLASEFEPTAQSIGIWVARADKQEGRREEAGQFVTWCRWRGMGWWRPWFSLNGEMGIRISEG